MSRKIIIDKYEGNTVYSVHVIDSFEQEHHLGYLHISELDDLLVNDKTIRENSEKIWSNEVKKEVDLMSKAIKNCIEIDKKNGILTRNRDGLD